LFAQSLIAFLPIAVAGQTSPSLGGFGITKPTNIIKVELDVEKRMQAEILKRQVRIKEFFHDFDRLRKGTVGEAGVSSSLFCQHHSNDYLPIVQDMPGNVKHPPN